ncbi:MAG: xanthine dehydrogenase family protein molybdopterin-binding subunit [Tepidisphaeraceae bacterium]
MPEQTYPVGIAGVDIEQSPRTVPDGEAPPLAINEKLNVIGKDTPRLDGKAKVTGAAKYTADINLPGMLFARMLCSPHPHAKIRRIDVGQAERAPGVKAVHILDKLLGVAQEKDKDGNKDGTSYPVARFAGQPIAAVAADTQHHADEAVRLIQVDYEVLPFVVDVAKARQDDSPKVFDAPAEQEGSAGGGGGPKGVPQKGNVRGPAKGGNKQDGGIDEAFKEADATVEGEYRTQVQTHSALETHGVVADWKDDMLTVYASTQGTGSVRDELANIFKLPKTKVRVITEFMGGGFGAKFGAGNFGLLATHLSKKAKAPVRLMLDRKEEHLCVGNRPSSNQKLKIGAKKDGSLVAIHLVNHGTGGVGTGAGASGPAQNMYTCPAIYTEDFDIFTHAGPAAAFRAPGHPQACFALEQAIDELAEKLQMDPLALREKIDPSDARREERKIGAEKIGWPARKPAGSDTGVIKRGVGVAQSVWYRMSSVRDSQCEVRILQDGSVEFLSAVQDIGGGIRTALAQVVAEELGLKPTDITMKIGDTSFPPGPASGGSVTTNSITPVARNAAWQAKKQLLEVIAPKLGAKPDDLDLVDSRVVVKSDPAKSMGFRKACSQMGGEAIGARGQRVADYPVEGEGQPPAAAGGDGGGGRKRRGPRGGGSGGLGGVQFAQVAVDTETGVIKVEKVVAIHDCGRPINPMATKSQVNGGVIQGLSYALFEDRILDRNTGVMVNANLEQYKIAGAKEMPEIESILIEQYWGRSSTDAAGIGEPATVPTAGAIANAVYNAIGVRMRQMPMTPAVVLAALNEKQKSGRTVSQ